MWDLTFRYNGRDWEDKIAAAHLKFETLKVTLSCLAILDLNQALFWKMAGAGAVAGGGGGLADIKCNPSKCWYGAQR